MAPAANIDVATVEGFGDEWSRFDQEALPEAERLATFEQYFAVFPWDALPAEAAGFDLGCGSGRWAALVAPRVGLLHCIDPAPAALDVARKRLEGERNVRFHMATANDIPLPDASQDFGYSLGVLHHIPDTAAALAGCTAKLKSGAPFLVYLYYDFENRPLWFRALWKASDLGRRMIARLPFGARKAVTTVIAAGVYWPLARGARLVERRGGNVGGMPLSYYRDLSFYSMRTDALDRFGTRLEQRFSRRAIKDMMERAGLTDIRFSDGEPYWVACGTKA